MFNRKLKVKVKYLEEELEKKDKLNSILREKLEIVEKYTSKMPADCVYGEYCDVCGFAKVFHIPNDYPSTTSFDEILVCGRSEVCPNFVKKSDVKGPINE